MDRQVDQPMSGVELRIWREDGGTWRCRVLTPSGFHTVRLDDQDELSAYIAGQIDIFVKEHELQERAAWR